MKPIAIFLVARDVGAGPDICPVCDASLVPIFGQRKVVIAIENVIAIEIVIEIAIPIIVVIEIANSTGFGTI